MKTALASLIVTLTLLAHANASVVITGIADNANSTSASGTLNGVDWTALTFESSPLLESTNPWEIVGTLVLPLPANSLFLTADNVNAGDFQLFRFAQPVENLQFYVENFDTGSVANLQSDAAISVIAAGQGMSYRPGHFDDRHAHNNPTTVPMELAMLSSSCQDPRPTSPLTTQQAAKQTESSTASLKSHRLQRRLCLNHQHSYSCL